METEPQQNACWKCKKQIDNADKYCRHCGQGQGPRINFYYKHWGAWLLFPVIGPFNLWFLLKSPYISKTWKIIDTFLILALTTLVCYIFVKALMVVFNAYSSLLYMQY